jgi:hypothetical protein
MLAADTAPVAHTQVMVAMVALAPLFLQQALVVLVVVAGNQLVGLAAWQVVVVE